MSASGTFNIYGFAVEIRSSSAAAFEGLAEDFHYFRSGASNNACRLELIEAPPPYDSLPPLTGTVYTPRNVSFRDGELTYVDYSGRALAIHNRKSGDFRIFSRESELLYEAAYLYLLSQISEFLDARRLHRIHALAMSVNGRAILVLLPMGGGKSTLGAQLLKYPGLGFLSDDSPFVDRHGRIHSFPLRLGLIPGNEADVPPGALRRINRMEFGPKLLVNHDYFAQRIRPSAEPGYVFLGRRSLSRGCEIRPARAVDAMRAMIANCVVGLGLFQGIEFVLQRSAAEIAGKAAIAYSRFRNCLSLVRGSENYFLILGRDPGFNARTLYEFLSGQEGGDK